MPAPTPSIARSPLEYAEEPALLNTDAFLGQHATEVGFHIFWSTIKTLIKAFLLTTDGLCNSATVVGLWSERAQLADNSLKVAGLTVGNANGNVPVNNGVLCTNLNAQYFNGFTFGGLTQGPYTGSSTSNVDYPVGSCVLVYCPTSAKARNAAFTVYLSGANTFMFSDTGSTALTGTWRARGMASQSAGFFCLAQRVA